MSGHGEKLGRKKEAAIAALLTQRSIEEAARAVNISGKTLRRWMRLPEFQTEYLQARRDTVLQTSARIQQNSGAAAAVQLKLMADPSTPASVRARTSQYMLEHSRKSLEQEDVLVRLAD
jgi:transposase-like protein